MTRALGYLLARSERGASAVEYALLVAGVSVLFVAISQGLGAMVGAIFRDALGDIAAP